MSVRIVVTVVLFLFPLCVISHHDDENVPDFVTSTCFQHSIDSSQINQCVTQRKVTNCDGFQTVLSSAIGACLCNKRVNGIDVSYIFDQPPNLPSLFDAKRWWDHFIENMIAMNLRILKGDSRIAVYNSFKENNDVNTNGLISISQWTNNANEDDFPFFPSSKFFGYSQFDCNNFPHSHPCQSRSYTCEAIKSALADIGPENNARKKVLVIFLFNEPVDFDDCLNDNNPFTKRRDDLSVLFVSSQLYVNETLWTSSDQQMILKLSQNIADSYLIRPFFREILENGEKLCRDTGFRALIADPLINPFIDPLICTIWSNPNRNEIYAGRDIERGLMRYAFPFISDHLCAQSATIQPTKSPTEFDASCSLFDSQSECEGVLSDDKCVWKQFGADGVCIKKWSFAFDICYAIDVSNKLPMYKYNGLKIFLANSVDLFDGSASVGVVTYDEDSLEHRGVLPQNDLPTAKSVISNLPFFGNPSAQTERDTINGVRTCLNMLKSSKENNNNNNNNELIQVLVTISTGSPIGPVECGQNLDRVCGPCSKDIFRFVDEERMDDRIRNEGIRTVNINVGRFFPTFLLDCLIEINAPKNLEISFSRDSLQLTANNELSRESLVFIGKFSDALCAFAPQITPTISTTQSPVTSRPSFTTTIISPTKSPLKMTTTLKAKKTTLKPKIRRKKRIQKKMRRRNRSQNQHKKRWNRSRRRDNKRGYKNVYANDAKRGANVRRKNVQTYKYKANNDKKHRGNVWRTYHN